jgi:hypothetical protein
MKLYWPGRIEDAIAMSQKFGANPAYYAKYGHKGHNGIDFSMPKGKPVYAMHDGWIVESTAKDTGYGLRLTQVIEADGRTWDITYGHFLSVEFPDIPWDFSLRKWPVRAGQRIGLCDSTGDSSGHHVHVTLRPYPLNTGNGFGGAVDPAPYLAPITERPQMNQTKVVLSKDGKTVYLATPVAMDFDNFKRQAGVEGIEIPTPIPPASSL